MKRTRIAMLTCLAVALSGPVTALATGGDDHGGSTQSGGGQSGKSGGDDHGGSTQSGGGQSGGSQPGDDHGGGQSGNSGNSGGNSGNSGGNSGGSQPGDDHGGGTQSGGGQPGDDHGNGGQPANFQKTEVRLALMPSGSVLGITGSVDIRAAGNKQRLQVEIEGNFADGTLFQVLANGLTVGSITGLLHHGELEVELENGATLPGGLLPSAVTSIEVRDINGNTLLSARFAAIPPAPVATVPAGGVTKTEVALNRVSAAATAVGATGQVELRVQGAQQQLEIRVDAAVADGTTWFVFANGIQVGTLNFRLRGAAFEIDSQNLLPAGLGSLAAITSVSITDGTSTVLSATLK